MAREYSERGFLIELDDHGLVEKYLRQRGISSFSYTKPAKKLRGSTEATVAEIEAVLHGQDDTVRQEIESDFSHVNELSSQRGMQNLAAETKDRNVRVPAEVGEMKPHDRALWYFIEQPDVFEAARSLQHFFDLSGWKRVPVPTKSANHILGKKDALGAALRKYFEENESQGRFGTVEMYPKDDCVYVVARMTGYGESNYVPDRKTRGIVKEGTRRSIFEIYFLYRPSADNSDGGELEIKARGGWQRQRDLLAVFSKAVLDHELDDSKQTFDLEPLKQRGFELAAKPAHEMEWWWLKSLTLRTKASQPNVIKISVTSMGKHGSDTIWGELDELGLGGKMDTLYINAAEFKVKFKPKKLRQRGTVTFHVNWKDSCSLNSIDEFHIKARDVLKTSKIDRGFGR